MGCERCEDWQRQGLSASCPACDMAMFSDEHIAWYKTNKEKLAIAIKALRRISSGLTTDQTQVERMTKREADEALKEIESL